MFPLVSLPNPPNPVHLVAAKVVKHKASLQAFSQLSATSSPLTADIATPTAPNLITPELSLTPEFSQQTELVSEFELLPVGLNLGNRNIIFSVLVRGREDGAQAVDFANWLVPFDAVVEALSLVVTHLEDGQLEVRSPLIVTRIDPQQISSDPELGAVLSIEQIRTLLGLPVEFDLVEYAIVIDAGAANQMNRLGDTTPDPVLLEGLPEISAPDFTLAAVEHQLAVSGSPETNSSFKSTLQAVGTFLGGSWYVGANQVDLGEPSTWAISEAQYLRQTPFADYAIGAQSTFWDSRSSEYWGVTTIQRQGFTPPAPFEGSGFNPTQRLQTGQLNRTLIGEAEPGTLVQLVQGLGNSVLDEVLVDSSGVYRFESLPVGGQDLGGGSYQVLLYPEGRLTANPEIRAATFSILSGQIPVGASATIFSVGLGRQQSAHLNLIEEFTDLRGGVAQRWGVSETLTVGLGGVYDQTFRGLAELFFKPDKLPLEVAVSALTPDQAGIWDVEANVFFRPTSNIRARFNRNRASNRLNLDWQAFPGITLSGIYNSQSGYAVGAQFSRSNRGSFTFARMTLDEHNQLRWNLRQRLDKLELTQLGNESGVRSELIYSLSDSSSLRTGHSLSLSYATLNGHSDNSLLTGLWRYRSPQQTADGQFLWETELGYGISSQGSGLIASVQTAALPGFQLRGRYRGASLSSGGGNFSIEVISSANFQQGGFPGDRQSDHFRSQGGLLLQPFFDYNNNGQPDVGEDYYTETADLLFILNNQPIQSSRPNVQADRVIVRLAPGVYRLDLDPAGFPLDWQTPIKAYAVEVVAGGYTPISIPLTRSYTFTGVARDATGEPIVGARIEAIKVNSEQRRLSITNGAGVYYLDGLQPGTYRLEINGEPTHPNSVVIDPASEPFQELNLQR